jgi:hypothetical protein
VSEAGSGSRASVQDLSHFLEQFFERGIKCRSTRVEHNVPSRVEGVVYLKPHSFPQPAFDAVSHDSFSYRARNGEADPRTVILIRREAECREHTPTHFEPF